MLLQGLALQCTKIIHCAEHDGLTIDDSNVVDLIADNTEASLSDIRSALSVAGLADRFPKATAGQ